MYFLLFFGCPLLVNQDYKLLLFYHVLLQVSEGGLAINKALEIVIEVCEAHSILIFTHA